MSLKSLYTKENKYGRLFLKQVRVNCLSSSLLKKTKKLDLLMLLKLYTWVVFVDRWSIYKKIQKFLTENIVMLIV